MFKSLDPSQPDYEKFKKIMYRDDFDDGMSQAYHKGYYIGYVGDGPQADKVLFLGGSSLRPWKRQFWTDWTGNLEKPFWSTKQGGLATGGSFFNELSSRRYVNKMDKIARDNNVDVVVGHSRAGGMVDRMKGPYRTVAVDGAMILNWKPGKTGNTTPNFHLKRGKGKGWYDGLIDPILAMGGKNNIAIEGRGYQRVPHYVWRDRPDYTGPNKRRRYY